MAEMKEQLRNVLVSVLGNPDAAKLLSAEEVIALGDAVSRLSTPTCSLPCGHNGPHSHQSEAAQSIREAIAIGDAALEAAANERIGLEAPRRRGRPPKAPRPPEPPAGGLVTCPHCKRQLPASALEIHAENCGKAASGYFDKDSFTS